MDPKTPDPARPSAAPLAEEVTRILGRISAGEPEAAEQLFPLIYQELRRVAGRQLRNERRDHTLQPTALVNEVWLRLVGSSKPAYENRSHFLRVASAAMRRILIDHARRRNAAKRQAGERRVPLSAAENSVTGAIEQEEYILALHEALERLAEFDPRQAQIVELRFFGGMTIPETAEALGVSHATVERDWRVAKAWLHREISGGGPD